MLSAASASFFSLARTFSLPGMTMYSVSKFVVDVDAQRALGQILHVAE